MHQTTPQPRDPMSFPHPRQRVFLTFDRLQRTEKTEARDRPSHDVFARWCREWEFDHLEGFPSSAPYNRVEQEEEEEERKI